MPTVPTEQNRVGIAGVTDAKLQPGDYSGSGLQALGAGLKQLGETGQRIAARAKERQDRHDELEVRKAWNLYSEQIRPLETDDGAGADTDADARTDWDPDTAMAAATQRYTMIRDQVRARLKTRRQAALFDHMIGQRFDYDLSNAFARIERRAATARERQADLVERNAGEDAAISYERPEESDRYIATAVESMAARAAQRNEDPATTRARIAAFRSGVERKIILGLIQKDPYAAARRFGLTRKTMTAADQAPVQQGLYEPLARAQGAGDVDSLLPPPETEGPAPLSQAQRDTIGQAIEAQPWTEARKRYAREDLAMRVSLDMA